MSDYKTDAERFRDQLEQSERDRKHSENLRLLSGHYGGGIDKVMGTIRRGGIHIVERDGVSRRLPSVSDFPRNLTDPELAELIVQKLSAWDELEDVTGLF